MTPAIEWPAHPKWEAVPCLLDKARDPHKAGAAVLIQSYTKDFRGTPNPVGMCRCEDFGGNRRGSNGLRFPHTFPYICCPKAAY